MSILIKNRYFILFASLLSVFIGCKDGDGANGNNAESNPPPPAILYSVVNVYPHDTASFTQGLSFYDGRLLESTGLYNTSWLGPVDLKTGKIDRKVTLTQEYFGEGNTVLNDKIYHLTWQ